MFFSSNIFFIFNCINMKMLKKTQFSRFMTLKNVMLTFYKFLLLNSYLCRAFPCRRFGANHSHSELELHDDIMVPIIRIQIKIYIFISINKTSNNCQI